MAMVKCKECGGMRSTKANACPRCGAKVKKTSLITWLAAIFIGLPFIVVSMHQKPESEPPPAPAKPTEVYAGQSEIRAQTAKLKTQMDQPRAAVVTPAAVQPKAIASPEVPEPSPRKQPREKVALLRVNIADYALKPFCIEKWSGNYEMQAYCLEQQRKAGKSVQGDLIYWGNQPTSSYYQSLVTCAEKWRRGDGYDFTMVEYCFEKQKEGISTMSGG